VAAYPEKQSFDSSTLALTALRLAAMGVVDLSNVYASLDGCEVLSIHRLVEVSRVMII